MRHKLNKKKTFDFQKREFFVFRVVGWSCSSSPCGFCFFVGCKNLCSVWAVVCVGRQRAAGCGTAHTDCMELSSEGP